MNQYLKIFKAPENGDTIETKRKAAKEVLGWYGMTGSGDDENQKPLTVNIFNDAQADEPRNVSDKNVIELSFTDLEKEMRELKQLEDMGNHIAKHESTIKGKAKSNGGFGEDDAPDIKLD